MRLHYFLITSILVTTSCENSKKSDETGGSDSSTLALSKPSDTVNTGTVSNAQIKSSSSDHPGILFPSYSLETLSTDAREIAISGDLDALISDYASKDYATIQGHYTRQWEYDGDHDKVSASESETRTWYLDAHYKLRGYTREYFRDGEGRDTKLLIYLFSNDSLIAVLDNWDQDGQIGMRYQKRILASHCPACGTDIKSEAGAESAIVNEVSDEDLIKLSHEFFENLQDELNTLNAERGKAAAVKGGYTVDIEYVKNANEQSPGTHYTVQYAIRKGIYENYISKKAGI